MDVNFLGDRRCRFLLPVQLRWRGLPQSSNRWHHGFMPKSPTGFSLAIEYDREEDGRWLADIPALPGVTAYGRTRKQATGAVQALALRLIADRLEHGETVPDPMNVSLIAA
jgi:predicted RNase H-like HicB family nuclease